MAKKKVVSKRGVGKKSTKKKTSRIRSDSPEMSKPTLLIDSAKLSGNSFRVGKRARVMVSGTVVEESIRGWETKGRKSYRMEIDRVSAPKKTKRSARK